MENKNLRVTHLKKTTEQKILAKKKSNRKVMIFIVCYLDRNVWEKKIKNVSLRKKRIFSDVEKRGF